jgi:predicted nucleic acid-binding protein
MGNRILAVYFDLNVYSRPFDDQTQAKIREETEAINIIWDQVSEGTISLVSSNILLVETKRILSTSKRVKVLGYIKLCKKHIDESGLIRQASQTIQEDCGIKPRDALHLASAIEAEVDYFITCDALVARKSTNRCVKRIAKKYGKSYVSVMDPIRFVRKHF